MITIHNANTIDFSNNGLGVLEPLSCILNLEINGGWSLEMEYPLDPDGKYLKIEEGKIIKVTGIGVVREQTEPYQLFRIYNVNKGLNSLKVIAFPVAFEATYDAVVDEYSTGSSEKTINSLLNDSTNGLMKKLSDEGVTKYTCSVDYEDCPTHKNDWKNTNLIAIIGGSNENSILNKYDAEVAYDNYTIRINHRIGEETDFEIRYGKNLTGLDVDTDTSGVVTRFYPISKEGIRYKGLNDEPYVESEEVEEYPFARCAFIQTDYPLVDTNEKSYSNAAILTREAKATIIEDITTVMESIWSDIKSGNKVNNQLYEAEWMQKSLNDIIAEVQVSTTLIPADSDAGLANLFRTCIKSGINWIKDEDIADYEWKTVSNNKYYGNSDRDLKSQYYYIDKMYRWFDENGIYHPEKDLNTMDWLNHIGQQQIGTPTKGFGNDTSTIARDAWVFTMDGDNQTGSNFNQYYFDADGSWDGVSEASEWDWQQTDNKWWFGKTGATDPKDYAHDEWVYIYKSSGTAPSNSPKLYYFGSDGYVLYDKNCSWNWYENKQKWYFGVAVTESNRIYLKNQWMKIDGDWYYFNNQELVAKDKTIRLGLVNYIVSQINNLGVLSEYTTRLYNRLYQSMYEYCESLYDEDGYDKPSITVKANVVDLSKTTEYEDFPDLMTIHLGDKVKVIDYVHYPDFEYHLRVVGLQYDCIRGYNTQVTIGDLSKKVSQMISANLGGKGEQKLVAGENVTIDGNTINAMTNVGDIYAGSQVNVEQIVHSGTEIAKIYVDGYPTSIYASGADVEVTPYKTDGHRLADIKTNNQHNYIYGADIQYGTADPSGGEDKDYYCQIEEQYTQEYFKYLKNSVWEQQAFEFDPISNSFYLKMGGTTVYGRENVFYMFKGLDTSKTYTVSFKGKLNVTDYNEGYYDEPLGVGVPADTDLTGKTWLGDYFCNIQLNSAKNSYSFSFIPRASTEYIRFSFSKLRGNVTGYFEVEDFKISPSMELIDNSTIKRLWINRNGKWSHDELEGGASRDELYSANSYQSSVNLSDDYTNYHMLLIQTYNNEDKESLSTMLNVSDLTTGNRIGINDYLLYTITNGTTLTFYDSFDDTNHSRHIKSIYGIKYYGGSGEDISITDVRVNNQSVVSGGIAFVDLTGKQDVLTVGANIQISSQNVISATDTTYSEFDGSTSGLVPSVQLQASKYLKDDGTWDYPEGTTVIANPSGTAVEELTTLQVGNDIYSIPSGGMIEIVTDILSLDYQKTTIANSEQSFAWSTIQFEGYEITCNNNPTAPLAEMIWDTPISADVKKIRFKFEPTAKKMSGSDDYNLFIGVKSTFNTSSSPTDQDWLVSKSYSTVVNPIEDELSITSSADYYLYIIANGWDVDITQVESVEYASGGASKLEDLGDVSISTPTNGQVLTYNATSQKWENATPSGGGGGNSITYGTNPPTVTGSEQDGDVYYLLDSVGMLKIHYLFKGNTWSIISGTFEKLTPQLSSSTGNIGNNGRAIAPTSNPNYQGNYAWRAFDGAFNANCQYSGENQSGAYIGYLFDSTVYLANITGYFGNYAVGNSFTVKLQVTTDGGTTWEDIDTFTVAGYANNNYGSFSNTVGRNINGFRYYSTTTKTSGTNWMTYEIQAYGIK